MTIRSSLGSPSPWLFTRHPAVELVSAASLPTEFGNFRIKVFTTESDSREHVAIIHGAVFGIESVPVRLHSECLTGDVMASLRCDCRKQLELGLRQIATMPCGALLYLRQEGRGIGLANKVRAYELQDGGLDTVDANLALGFRDDERDYGVAVGMLRTLGVRSVQLMTNNPDKIAQLRRYGLPVTKRVARSIPPSAHNRRYLETKARRSGHCIDVTAESVTEGAGAEACPASSS